MFTTVGYTPTRLRILTSLFVCMAIFVLCRTKMPHKFADKSPNFREVEKNIFNFGGTVDDNRINCDTKNHHTTTNQHTNNNNEAKKKEKMDF